MGRRGRKPRFLFKLFQALVDRRDMKSAIPSKELAKQLLGSDEMLCRKRIADAVHKLNVISLKLLGKRAIYSVIIGGSAEAAYFMPLNKKDRLKLEKRLKC